MKKKRKNRWRNGVIRRKKSCSHLKDNPNTAESGDEDEDEDDDGKLAESEDPEKMKDVECESMEADECAESTAVVQNNISNEGREHDNTTSAVDEVVSVETVQNNATDGHNDVQASESTEPKRTEPSAEDSSGVG